MTSIAPSPFAANALTTRARVARSPWSVNDSLLLAATAFTGTVLLFIAWYGSAGRGHLGDQIVWINLGVVALIVQGAGAGVFLLKGRRAIGERRARLLPYASASPRATLPPDVEVPAEDTRPGALVQAAGMRLAHRGDCVIVAGKVTQRARPDAPPCGICGG